MSQRTPEEQREYEKRKQRIALIKQRRRKEAVTKTIVISILLLAVLVLTCLIKAGVHTVFSREPEEKTPKIEVVEPSATPEYNIPKGYGKYDKKLKQLQKKYPDVEKIRINMYQYPENLLKLVTTNQETLDFVVNYPLHKTDTKAVGKLKKKDIGTGIPLFNQWDKRWGYVTYGNDILAIDGCGPTCLSMVVTGLTKTTKYSPADVARLSISKSYYNADMGSAWSLMTEGAKTLGVKAHNLAITSTNVKKQLKQNRPVICSMAPGDFTTQGHFIVLTGLTKMGKLKLNDPNSIANSRKEWEITRVIDQVKVMWSYTRLN